MISLLDRPVSDYSHPADAIRPPMFEPKGESRPFQQTLIDLANRLGLQGFCEDDGTPKFKTYKEFITGWEPAPGAGIGFLAGWREEDNLLQKNNGEGSLNILIPCLSGMNRLNIRWSIRRCILLAPSPKDPCLCITPGTVKMPGWFDPRVKIIKMKKCALCADRIDNENLPEEESKPACVLACPSRAKVELELDEDELYVKTHRIVPTERRETSFEEKISEDISVI